ncbi:hypothetical protein [Acinetobacter baumannii]|uniref:hypothetical protein n=1 Tax=Acinetobacter baumannii TaxID=470 RepID=UPI002449000E|nr:hypothetical protein [Acinetobacter baumannii]MDH2562924.1 hypothetical protein [Acinetobacter baumannii]
MAAATQNTDETLVSTDEQATTKPKNTRNKTNKTSETQNTQSNENNSSDQGDLLNSQGPENGASQEEGEKPTDLKNGDSDNGNSTESSNDSVKPSNDLDSNINTDVGNLNEDTTKIQHADISNVKQPIVENLTGDTISSVDPLVIKVTNNGFSTVLEPLSRVAIEAGQTASITCHNQTFKHQVLENLRQLKGLGKNLIVE